MSKVFVTIEVKSLMQHYCPAAFKIVIGKFLCIEEIIEKYPESAEMLRQIQRDDLRKYTETFENCEYCISKLTKEHGDVFFNALFESRRAAFQEPAPAGIHVGTTPSTTPSTTPVSPSGFVAQTWVYTTPVKAPKPVTVPGAPIKIRSGYTTPVKMARPLVVPPAPTKSRQLIIPPAEPTKRARPVTPSGSDTEEYPDIPVLQIRPEQCELRYTPNISQIPPGLQGQALEDFYTQWHNQRVTDRF